jgi:hypothetical protein
MTMEELSNVAGRPWEDVDVSSLVCELNANFEALIRLWYNVNGGR